MLRFAHNGLPFKAVMGFYRAGPYIVYRVHGGWRALRNDVVLGDYPRFALASAACETDAVIQEGVA